MSKVGQLTLRPASILSAILPTLDKIPFIQHTESISI